MRIANLNFDIALRSANADPPVFCLSDDFAFQPPRPDDSFQRIGQGDDLRAPPAAIACPRTFHRPAATRRYQARSFSHGRSVSCLRGL